MTEKEKMLSGEAYNSRDPELLSLYFKARKLLQDYNRINAEDLALRNELLTRLFQRKAPGVWLELPFYCDYGIFISIGENTFINTQCVFLDSNYITIGRNGLIGPNVQIYTATHPLEASERIPPGSNGSYRTFSRPVTIGDNAWIGGNAVICPGVTIGNNVTIGAGSVVTRDIPGNVLAFGNPCRVDRSL